MFVPNTYNAYCTRSRHLFCKLSPSLNNQWQVSGDQSNKTTFWIWFFRNLYLSVYGILGFLQSITIMLGTVVLSVGTLNAATTLHGTMLKRFDLSKYIFSNEQCLRKEGLVPQLSLLLDQVADQCCKLTPGLHYFSYACKTPECHNFFYNRSYTTISL